jgi:hypothetical protein
MAASPAKTNPNLVYIKSTTGSIFRKKRINQDTEDTIGMCHKLLGQTLRPHLWAFVKKVPVYTKSDLDVLHSMAISMDLELKIAKYGDIITDSAYAISSHESAQDDMPF